MPWGKTPLTPAPVEKDPPLPPPPFERGGCYPAPFRRAPLDPHPGLKPGWSATASSAGSPTARSAWPSGRSPVHSPGCCRSGRASARRGKVRGSPRSNRRSPRRGARTRGRESPARRTARSWCPPGRNSGPSSGCAAGSSDHSYGRAAVAADGNAPGLAVGPAPGGGHRRSATGGSESYKIHGKRRARHPGRRTPRCCTTRGEAAPSDARSVCADLNRARTMSHVDSNQSATARGC